MAKERSKLQRKLDAFSRALFLDENGKPKSATVLYSFLLAVLYTVIDAAAYLLLLDVLEAALSDAPVWARNVVQYLVPAIVGSIPCVGLFFLLRERKNLVPCAYLWMAVLLVGMSLAELLLIDWSDAATEYGLYMVLLGIPGILSVAVGGVPAWLLYRRYLKREAERKAQAPKRPSYYNT